MKNKNCSNKSHIDIHAVSFCKICNIYMCNKCLNHHKELFDNIHKEGKLDNTKEVFNGFCKEEKHINQLEYFCKNHNILCCVACLCIIKDEFMGHHKDCDVCKIDNIENEKRKILEENIKYLQNLSNELINSINELKRKYEIVSQNKEDVKLEIQKKFTAIRNEINDREDELLLEVDNKFNNIYFKEEFIKENNKLPEQVKKLLNKSEKIKKNWKNNSLNSMVNECVSIENEIKNIKIKYDKINAFNNNALVHLEFVPEGNNIKTFGKINYKKLATKSEMNIHELINYNDWFTRHSKNNPKEEINNVTFGNEIEENTNYDKYEHINYDKWFLNHSKN